MKDDCRKWLKNYGDLLRKARKELGMSQLELARKLGCSQAIISFIECGYMLPPLDLEEGLCAILGIHI